MFNGNQNFGALKGAYGPASQVPDFIEQLKSRDAKLREDARKRLAASLSHQGTAYPATPAAVPLLLDLLADPKTPERAALLTLVVQMAVGSPYYHLTTGLNRARFQKADGQYLKQGYEQIENRLDLLIGLLEDPKSSTRSAAAYALGFFPAAREQLGPVLVSALEKESERAAQAAILISLGFLHAGTGQVEKALTSALTSDDPIIRTAAALAIALSQSDEQPSSTEASRSDERAERLHQVLLEAAQDELEISELPWCEGNLSRYAARLLSDQPDQDLETLGALLCQVPGDPALLKTILPRHFERSATPLDPAALNSFQRPIAAWLAEHPRMWLELGDLDGFLEAVGLPDRPRAFAKALGLSLPPTALDLPLSIQGQGTEKAGSLTGRECLARLEAEPELVDGFKQAICELDPEQRLDLVFEMLAVRPEAAASSAISICDYVLERTWSDARDVVLSAARRVVKDGEPSYLGAEWFVSSGKVAARIAILLYRKGELDLLYGEFLKLVQSAIGARQRDPELIEIVRALPLEARQQVLQKVRAARGEGPQGPTWQLVALAPSVSGTKALIEAVRTWPENHGFSADSAAEQIGKIGAPAVSLILDALKRKPATSPVLVLALGETHATEAAPELVKLLSSRTPAIEAAAREGFVRLGVEAARAELEALLSNSAKAKRRLGAELLAQLEPSPARRELAAQALRNEKAKEIRALLEPLAKPEG